MITEIQLRLYGVPEAIAAGVCQFPDLASAVNTVIAAMQMGIPVARIELLDEVMIRGVNNYARLGIVEAPTLFLEFHGTRTAVLAPIPRAKISTATAAKPGSREKARSA